MRNSIFHRYSHGGKSVNEIPRNSIFSLGPARVISAERKELENRMWGGSRVRDGLGCDNCSGAILIRLEGWRVEQTRRDNETRGTMVKKLSETMMMELKMEDEDDGGVVTTCDAMAPVVDPKPLSLCLDNCSSFSRVLLLVK